MTQRHNLAKLVTYRGVPNAPAQAHVFRQFQLQGALYLIVINAIAKTNAFRHVMLLAPVVLVYQVCVLHVILITYFKVSRVFKLLIVALDHHIMIILRKHARLACCLIAINV